MLAQACRTSGLRVWTAAPSLPTAARTFSTFDDRERGEELVHFKKEDERLLRQLLAKVKKQADAGDAGAAKATEVEQLKAVLGSKADAATIEALIKWKHEH